MSEEDVKKMLQSIFVPKVGDFVQRPASKAPQTLFFCNHCTALTSHNVHDDADTARWISCWKCGRVNRVTSKVRKVTRCES